MAWIEQRTPEEVAAQVRRVFTTDIPPKDDWDKGWAAAVEKIAGFLESDYEEKLIVISDRS